MRGTIRHLGQWGRVYLNVVGETWGMYCFACGRRATHVWGFSDEASARRAYREHEVTMGHQRQALARAVASRRIDAALEKW